LRWAARVALRRARAAGALRAPWLSSLAARRAPPPLPFLRAPRLFSSSEAKSITSASRGARFAFGSIEIVSKIVEGKFPDYQKVIPTTHKNRVSLDRATLAQSLNRAAILSNEKIRGVRLVFTKDALSIICTNNEQEEAEEGLAVEYDGDPLDIGFNISYLLDVLNHVDSPTVSVAMGDSNSSALVQMPGREDFKYVVMPMRI